MGLVIGLDGDDTLWHNERIFVMTHDRFRQMLTPFASADDLDAWLLETERRNIDSLGYGVKSFTLSGTEEELKAKGLPELVLKPSRQ